MTTPLFTEGQQVIYLPTNSRVRTEVTIEKVGRKLVHATVYGRPMSFYLDTGYQANTQYMPARIATTEILAAEDDRTAAVTRLRELGVVSEGYGGFKVSTATLHNLITVMENPV